MFDEFLRSRAAQTGEPFVPFDPVRDYAEYVDGRARWPWSLPGGPAASASSWESTGSDRLTRSSSTARISSSATWPSCSSANDHAPRLHGRAVVRAGDEARPRRAGADGIGLRAL